MSEIRQVTVVGAGTMGHGIAHAAALAGYRVVLNDLSSELVDRGLCAIRDGLDRDVAKCRIEARDRDAALERISTSTDLSAAVADAGLVVEAVPESLELKRELFTRIERAAPARAVLASNTSSLSIEAIGEATGSPERVVGMHFFNPVPRMPLVEVVRSPATSQGAVDQVRSVADRMGKETIVVRDVPGFATSRLGVVLGLEAMRMLEQGVASAEDIDKAMTLGYRHPMGPLRLSDLIGLDVRLAIARHLHGQLASEAFRPPEILERMVAEGRLGKKSGQGFYRWDA